jgi:hypothetical protein
MIRTYSNQNHRVNRNDNPFEKIASVYDRMGVSNRVVEKSRVLSFSTTPAHESEVILNHMRKEAAELALFETMNKTANLNQSPFEMFGMAKNYIASKLGFAPDMAHDLASSVVARGQDLQKEHGGQLGDMVKGIVDQMDPNQIQQRMGARPMRSQSPNEVEESVKDRLMKEMPMSSHQADLCKKIVLQQARNLTVQYRNKSLAQICDAIVEVMLQHRDASIAYGISSSERLRPEIETHLNQMP